jgi:single-stranded-DNA-specific exonuclease
VTWQFPPDGIQPSGALREAVGGHPLVAAILARRGITEVDAARAYLDPATYTPAPPADLPDVDIAAGRLLDAIARGERILIWGDFDVDGQTSTSLLVDALLALGGDVLFHVPHRMKGGHGVHPAELTGYLADGVDVVLTCDTGIAAHEAVAAVHAAGATMLITDHHALPPELPPADALVNPQRLPPGHALRDLPGVGVTYKLVQYLYAEAGRAGEERRFLDLVALGIVADVAAQRRDTRYLLQLGMDRLRDPQRVGLQELMLAAQVDPSNLSADTIGFQVGPRLNALGRLGDASLAVDLLTTDDRGLARQIAGQLEALNAKRRQIQDQITAAALAQIDKDPSLREDFDAIVLDGEKWHPGVIGIVAARIVELTGKPAVLLASPPGEPARGSARSVPGVDIGAAIASCADLLLTHGGHPGAAGCSLDRDLIPQFRRRLSNAVGAMWDHSAAPGPHVDAEIRLGDITMELAGELNRLAPFGEGNPPVHLMAPRLRVTADAVFGIKRDHRRVTVEDDAGASGVLTWWRGTDGTLPRGVFDLILIPRINDYKGRRSLQLEWVASRPTPGVAVEIEIPVEVVDLRSVADPLAALPDGVAVWAEAVSPGDLPFDAGVIIHRADAHPADALAVWTAPPGPAEIDEMVAATGARTFYVAAQHAPDDTPEGFLRRLAGLANYALAHYGGEASVRKLAAATAQREVTARRGLEWLAAKGMIALEWADGDTARLSPGGAPDPGALPAVEDSLAALLAEARAFRGHFRRTGELDNYFRV